MRRSLLFIVLCGVSLSVWAQLPIGGWRAHHSYNTIYSLAEDRNTIYAASAMNVLEYHLGEWTTTTLSTTNGLSDVGISTIAFDSTTHTLVIAYRNANIDLVCEGNVFNLSDIKRSDISGDKNIYRIRFINGKAFLATGFGVVVVDLERHEIEDTYHLGPSDAPFAVYDIVSTSNQIVVATNRGLLKAPKNDSHLSIASHWVKDSSASLQNLNLSSLDVAANRLLILGYSFDPNNQVLLQEVDTGFVVRDTGEIAQVNCSYGKILVTHNGYIDIFAPNFVRIAHLDAVDWASIDANGAMLDRRGVVWIAHKWGHLCSVENVPGVMKLVPPQQSLPPMVVYSIDPGGPATDNVYNLVPTKEAVIHCPGGHHTTYAGMYLSADISLYQNSEWHALKNNALKNSLRDILNVAIDPNDPNHYMAASWGVGLAEIRDNEVVRVFTDTNSNGALERYVKNDFSVLLTGDVAYDLDGNLWITNSLVNKGLAVRYADGRWRSFATGSMVGGSDIDHIVCDSVTGYKWFYGRANKIFVHDGENQMAYVDPNNGSKKNTTSVNCLVQDHQGDLWMGTNGGIKVIYDGYKAFDNGGNGQKSPVNCSNIVISNGNFVEYLMAYENVTCIAVDGANRKWVGTASGGLYLISSNGLDELLHFTTGNSPLLSNKIITIAIHPKSGEVFIGTDKGIIAYRGTATYAETAPQEDIHAFPNPVKPDYDGPIAIKGFTRNASVHVTDASGHVVYSTQAFGGQAIWYGRTNSGERVSSGVYFVFAADAEGNNRSVAKILIIR